MNLILGIVGVLRRLWRQIVRRPVPVPVRARYNSTPLISTMLADHRTQTDETRRPPRW
ncbi:MAG: hypothetical protein FWD53_01050 [Phycisphaerales bacterium]|nr:hypothetical protein [Phycisphaerales bacterium]